MQNIIACHCVCVSQTCDTFFAQCENNCPPPFLCVSLGCLLCITHTHCVGYSVKTPSRCTVAAIWCNTPSQRSKGTPIMQQGAACILGADRLQEHFRWKAVCIQLKMFSSFLMIFLVMHRNEISTETPKPKLKLLIELKMKITCFFKWAIN